LFFKYKFKYNLGHFRDNYLFKKFGSQRVLNEVGIPGQVIEVLRDYNFDLKQVNTMEIGVRSRKKTDHFHKWLRDDSNDWLIQIFFDYNTENQ